MQLGFFSLPDLSSINWSSIIKTAAPAALQLTQVKQQIDTQKAIQNLQAQQQAAQVAQQQAMMQALQAGTMPTATPQGRVSAQPIIYGGGRERPWMLPAVLVAVAVGAAVLFQRNRSK